MADEGMESVGGVSVTITGDYSQLEEALQAAIPTPVRQVLNKLT